MAILSVSEAQPHATFTAHRKDGRRWSCPFNVETDSARTGPGEIVDYFDQVLQRGLGSTMRYADESDDFAFCVSMAPARKAGSATQWSCQLEYETRESEDPDQPKWTDDQGLPTTDPLTARGDFRVTQAFVQVPVWKAWNVDAFPIPPAAGGGYSRPANTLGPVVNSAGAVLDPPLMTDITETILSYSANCSTLQQKYLDNCVNHINSKPLKLASYLASRYSCQQLLFDTYTIKCTGGEATFNSAVDAGKLVEYWRLAYEFRIRPRATATNPFDGWLETVLDRGLSRRLDAGDPDGYGGTISAADLEEGEAKLTPIRGHDGPPVSELVLLNGGGQPAEGTYEQTGVYCRWRVNPQTDFSDLGHLIFVP